MAWLEGIILPATLALCGGLCRQQPPAQEPPPQREAAAPAPRAPQQDSRRRSVIPSIAEYRHGHTVDVMRAGEQLELDLRQVDFEADVLFSIDGRPIAQTDLRRTLCLLAGSNEIDQFITFILVKRVRERMQRSGVDLSGIAVSEEEVVRKFEEQKQLIPQGSGMSVEDWERQIREVFGWNNYVEFQKVQLQIEKLFLPDPPAEFLKRQSEAFETLNKNWEKRKSERVEAGDAAAAQEPPPVPDADLSFVPAETFELLDVQFGKLLREQLARGQPLHPILKTAAGAAVKRGLLQRTKIDMSVDVLGIAPEAPLLIVDGEPISVPQVYTLVQPRVDGSVRGLALREMLMMCAADRALERDGAARPSDATEAALAEMEKEYAGTIFPLDKAIQLRGFFNLYHYKRYFHRKGAYHEMLKARLPDAAQLAHFNQAGRLFYEHGEVDGIVLFIAGDSATAAPKMDEALAPVRAGEVPFADVAKKRGEFPVPPQSRDIVEGRVVARNRNRLRQAIGETEYVAFVTGYSLADEVFYRATEGEILGPVQRDYSPKLTGQIAFQVGRYYTSGASRSFEESKNNVVEDIADLTFPRYAMESLAQRSIEIPRRSH